ncbi:hypothetical protein MFU01_50600 [Myxococcus fulvus]|uniref:Uncharacterized protein n=1 Tax=Myxococcus fulvus TaxID=33 RepID=A0A511T8V4_MYXFU|nr:hypothetical protein MFU01_50600 [Myxococcus fulvus]
MPRPQAQLRTDANSLSVDLPELQGVLGQVLPGGLPGTIETLPVAADSVVSLITPIIGNIFGALQTNPTALFSIPTSAPGRVAVSELRTDLQASRATLPPFCD